MICAFTIELLRPMKFQLYTPTATALFLQKLPLLIYFNFNYDVSYTSSININYNNGALYSYVNNQNLTSATQQFYTGVNDNTWRHVAWTISPTGNKYLLY
jgi:hypothetical protein